MECVPHSAWIWSWPVSFHICLCCVFASPVPAVPWSLDCRPTVGFHLQLENAITRKRPWINGYLVPFTTLQTVFNTLVQASNVPDFHPSLLLVLR
jgi:hypothetical protein